jgi:putative transposase
VKKPHRFLSLVYPQSGWRLSDIREVGLGKNKKRKARLYLSKIGFFTLVIHRELPESQVSQVCVKLEPSGRIHVIFIVEEPETQVQASKIPRKAVGVDVGIARLATLSDGRFLGNPRPLEPSIGSGCYRGRSQGKGFSRITGLKLRGNLRRNTST